MCKFCGYAFWNLKVYQRKIALGSSISYYYAWIFTRKEIKFFQFCGFLNILKSFGRVLQSVSAYWLFSAHIYRRLPTHLDWIFTKKLVCTPPNTVAARIFGRVELTLENAARAILALTKNVQDWFHSLMSIPAIITAATLTRVETDFLELVFYQWRYATMSLCRCWSLQ